MSLQFIEATMITFKWAFESRGGSERLSTKEWVTRYDLCLLFPRCWCLICQDCVCLRALFARAREAVEELGHPLGKVFSPECTNTLQLGYHVI